jgi:hypothetical protein
MDFNVNAKFQGHGVSFLVAALDIKQALIEAKKKANSIFDHTPAIGIDDPKVSVKEVKEKEEKD